MQIVEWDGALARCSVGKLERQTEDFKSESRSCVLLDAQLICGKKDVAGLFQEHALAIGRRGPLRRNRGHGFRLSNLDALRAMKDDQAADRQRGHKVIAARNAVCEPQDGIAFEGTGIIQDRVFADIFPDSRSTK